MCVFARGPVCQVDPQAPRYEKDRIKKPKSKQTDGGGQRNGSDHKAAVRRQRGSVGNSLVSGNTRTRGGFFHPVDGLVSARKAIGLDHCEGDFGFEYKAIEVAARHLVI